jgi:hypothetical protein
MNIADTIYFENQYFFNSVVHYQNNGFANRLISTNNLSKRLKPLRGEKCIYFLMDQENVVYIGKTINPYERINFHRQNKDFKEYLIGILKNQYNQTETELELIKRYKPFYNLADKISFRQFKKVSIWLTQKQYEKLKLICLEKNIKQIEYLNEIISKKIKP